MQARTSFITPDNCVYAIRESKDLPLNIDEDYGDGTGLLIAAKHGWLDIVKLFIKGNATLDKRGYLGFTALMVAACNQNTDVVKELISAGAQIELASFNGVDALGWSLLNNNGSFSTVRVLLEAGAPINSTVFLLGLLKVDVPQEVMEDKYVCLSILCEQEEEKHEKNISDAEDLLHTLPQPPGGSYKIKAEAVIKEIDEATSQLFPKDLSKMVVAYDNPFRHRLFDNKNNNKEVKIKESLIEAAKNGHTESLSAILEDKTINVNIEGETNYVNLVDEYGMTPLMWAALNGHIETVRALLKHKMVYVNLEIQYGSTALIEAAREGHTEIVTLLLANKADVNRQDGYRDTALTLAARYGYIEMVKALLENKTINVNLQNWDGMTALLEAARCGYVAIVRELVEHKADVEIQSRAGFTALSIANHHGKKVVVEFLTSYTARCEPPVQLRV